MTDIELVIKIPKEQYITLNAKTQEDIVAAIDSDLLIKAIANGTPIDDDSLLAALMLFAMDNVTPQSKAQIKEKLLQILDKKGE